MKVKCLHGFFIFEETRVGQVSDFMSSTGLVIASRGPDYTFGPLVQAPTFSLKGTALMDATALKTFEGEPWEVFEANQVVYDFQRGLVVPIASISQKTRVSLAGNRYTSPGLILPGSVTEDGKRVRDYAAWFSRDRLTWLYSEVGYV